MWLLKISKIFEPAWEKKQFPWGEAGTLPFVPKMTLTCVTVPMLCAFSYRKPFWHSHIKHHTTKSTTAFQKMVIIRSLFISWMYWNIKQSAQVKLSNTICQYIMLPESSTVKCTSLTNRTKSLWAMTKWEFQMSLLTI